MPFAEPTVSCMDSAKRFIRVCIRVMDAIIEPRSSDIVAMSPIRSVRNCRFCVMGTDDMLI